MRLRCLPLVALLLAAPLALHAQDAVGRGGVYVGLDQLQSAHLGLRASTGLRVELDVAIDRITQEDPSLSFSYTTSELGLGVLLPVRTFERASLYVGPRIARIGTSQSVEGDGFNGTIIDESESYAAFMIAAVAGGEYRPVPLIGLGGEVQLRYTDLPEPKEDTGFLDPPPTQTLATRGRIVVRLYF